MTHPHPHPQPHARPHATDEDPGTARGNRTWPLLVLLCLAQFMLVLDVTVVNVALPSMAADLGLGRTALTWVVTSYALCFGGLMLLGGRLADVFGARRTLLAGLALFTAASLFTGLAPNAAVLIAGRTAQGAGAALLSPAALAILTTTFEGPARHRALGVWAAIGGAGSAIGVLLGGLLTDGPGWEWIFYVNVPVGVALLVTLPLLVAARPPRPARLDVPGALLATAGTGALIYGLVEAGDSGWNDVRTLLPIAAAILAYGVFAAVERAHRSPLIDLRILRRRPVVAGAYLMLVATALLISLFFLGSVYLQEVRGFSALRTGVLFLPVAVATGLGAHLGGHFVGRAGARPTGFVGLALAGLGTGALTGIGSEGNAWVTVAPGLSVAALGLGAVFVAATTTALGFIAHEEAGIASGLVNTFHEVGGSVGVAVVSTVAAAGIAGGSSGAFEDAFTVCAAAAAVSAAAVFAIVPRGTARVTGGPHAH
ncbi:DHA2 family efflux MFS transporter permease subunit [Streptomyces kanamyceticus]|uniref:DHA2 family efflux MFS transporter permease subunit n=1 Tax=Streptomyces kanamyceticus TaxID=1967 RepID=A0A5J6G3Z0_STRKN|nr:DHA2 family efflux MFS transporter permease subunit [Streptomyces kanamyceticus]QEU90330.1 DHA2 family efflux MFS transporter permease subunit [Streptomyces kanamyceticus]